MKKVAIIMGSDSDISVVREAYKTLEMFNIVFETHVISAHRTPKIALNFAENAANNEFGVKMHGVFSVAFCAAHIRRSKNHIRKVQIFFNVRNINRCRTQVVNRNIEKPLNLVSV